MSDEARIFSKQLLVDALAPEYELPAEVVILEARAAVYERACISACGLGLGAGATLLNLAGWDADVWQSGGFTMVLTIDLAGDRQIWVTYETCDPERYLVGRYKIEDEEWVEDVDDGNAPFTSATLEYLLEAVESLAD